MENIKLAGIKHSDKNFYSEYNWHNMQTVPKYYHKSTLWDI